MDKLRWNRWIVKARRSKRRLKQVIRERARERESTHHRHTQDIMSTSVKQERTICVLLPNKDQLDITVGVSLNRIYPFEFETIKVPYVSTTFGSTTYSLHMNACWIQTSLSFHLLQPKSTGQDVLSRVAELLGIKELHFFGLTVVKGKFTPHWPPSLEGLVALWPLTLFVALVIVIL